MKPNIILILVMGGIILIMGASSHPTSKEPLTYEKYSLLNINNMLEQSKFLVSFDCQNEKFCEELIITYRTEELRPYLIFPRVKLNPNYYTDSGATFNKHLRTQNKLKQKRK